MSGPLNDKEVEWYLRDHFFRQSTTTGKSEFDARALPNEIIRLYLRFRNTPLDEMAGEISEALERLALLKFILKSENSVRIQGKIERLQCTKCFYICYLGPEEDRQCLRCPSRELTEFPRNKQS